MKVSLIADVISFRGRSSTRHLLYQSAHWDLDLFLCREEGGIEITGQVLPREAADRSKVFNAVAVLVEQNTLIDTTTVTSAGEFEFRHVPESDLHLELFLNSTRLAVSFRP